MPPPMFYTAQSQTEQNMEKNIGTVFGVVSIVCAIVGFFVAAVLLGPLAIIIGCGAIYKHSIKLGVGGIIFGILDIVGWAITILMAVGY